MNTLIINNSEFYQTIIRLAMSVSILSSSLMTYFSKTITLASELPIINKFIPARFTNDDLILMKALDEIGIKSEINSWSSAADWKKFKACIIRSTWDYHKSRENTAKFLSVLAHIERIGVSLLNPYATIQWNIDKIYLKELADKGIQVVETIWLNQQDLTSLEQKVIEKGWKDCVIKPSISASGMLTKKFTIEESANICHELQAIREVDRWMVQPFMDEIITEGEKSFIFIKNRFSHCVLKKPSQKSILVQKGTVTKIEPSQNLVIQAEKILKLANQQTVYARVDVIEKNGQLILMELELIEPSLYLSMDELAPRRLALAIQDSILSL